ncbi:hypothetical protein [Roseibium sp.]|uniref:hypothetical protein n=1 Tax=Roseibium sp. TaxID=1936156 RepID=UPI003A96F6AF
MTELLGVAALAVGGYWIVKRMKRKMAEVEKHLSEMAAKATGEPKPSGTLVQDPVTGKYRPQ